MLTGICIILLVLVAVYAYGLYRPGRLALTGVAALGLAYYALLLTTGRIKDLFDMDPYSQLYPNLWEHGLQGNFGIDPQYAFREYFINQQGDPTVYFGFMPAMLRGIAGIFNGDIYGYNLGNLSILLAVTLCMAAVGYALYSLRLLQAKTDRYALGFFAAILFASPLAYTAIWGRVHNEVIAWSTSWGIIFVAFYALWVFGKAPQRRYWQAAVMGAAVGFALMTRPTVAITLVVAFAFLVGNGLWSYYRHKKLRELQLLLPGIICAVLLGTFTMLINYQRWGNPLTFVQMERHVELLKENPQRGEDLLKAGEFNANRLPSSVAYYFIPSQDNLSQEWPFVEIDQRLSIMQSAPQYDYIEGSRVPIIVSALFLVVIAVFGISRIRQFKLTQQYASLALLTGGGITLLALCAVYAVSLRYSNDLLPLIVFGGFMCLIYLKEKPLPKFGAIGWHVLLLVSIGLTLITNLQYKIISGQIGLSPEFRTNLSRRINFPPENDAKIFIINGMSHPAVPYQE